MNILHLSADGVDGIGYQVLREAASRLWNPPITLLTKVPRPGCSMAITLPEDNIASEPPVAFREVENGIWEIDGTPADALYLAMCWPEKVLGLGKGFDLVLTGVNQGQNTGIDTIHSGTVATAALAASVFGVTAMAFSQQTPGKRGEDQKAGLNRRETFKVADGMLVKFLQELPMTPGYCCSVNFPAEMPKGFKRCAVGMRSRWFPEYVPMRNQDTDADWLEKGYVTVTDLNLSLTETIRF